MSDTPPATAKLFMHGRSQAVRLPKEFRFGGSEVYVRRQGDEVVLSSRPRASIQSLIDALNASEPGPTILREQPAAAPQRAAIDPGAGLATAPRRRVRARAEG